MDKYMNVRKLFLLCVLVGAVCVASCSKAESATQMRSNLSEMERSALKTVTIIKR